MGSGGSVPRIVTSDKTILVKETYDQVKARIDAAHTGKENQTLTDPVFIEFSAFVDSRTFGGTAPVLINLADIKRVEWGSS